MTTIRSRVIPLAKVLNAATGEVPNAGSDANPAPATPDPRVLPDRIATRLFEPEIGHLLDAVNSRHIATKPESATPPLPELRDLQGDSYGSAKEYLFLERLRSLDPDTLNATIKTADLAKLTTPWMDGWLSQGNRLALIGALTRDRLPDLDIPARAALITALQRGGTDYHAEEAICRIFLGTTGKDLTRLKNEIDGGNNEHDLHKLVYSDIDKVHIRQRILDHIAREGRANPTGRFKKISDIDDTLIAWKDPRYPRHTVYPGMITFYEEFDRRDGENSDLLSDLVFLTARPTDFLGLVEAWTHGTLKAKGIPRSVILTGGLGSVLGNGRIARRKFRNYVEYKNLYPEYRFFFTGDNRQEDHRFAELARETYPEDMPLATIHDVMEAGPVLGSAYAAVGVPFYNTAIGNARLALGAALMSPAGAVRVAESAVTGFRRIRFDTPEQRAHVQFLLQRDLRALAVLPNVILTESLIAFLRS